MSEVILHPAALWLAPMQRQGIETERVHVVTRNVKAKGPQMIERWAAVLGQDGIKAKLSAFLGLNLVTVYRRIEDDRWTDAERMLLELLECTRKRGPMVEERLRMAALEPAG